jgi:hypothetical protein
MFFFWLMVAFVTMVITDLVGVMLVQAEARNHGWLSGWLDTAQWLPGILCSTVTITILQSNSWLHKILVILVVSAANLFGTKFGQVIGTKYIKDTHAMSTKEAIADLNSRVEALTRTAMDHSHN